METMNGEGGQAAQQVRQQVWHRLLPPLEAFTAGKWLDLIVERGWFGPDWILAGLDRGHDRWWLVTAFFPADGALAHGAYRHLFVIRAADLPKIIAALGKVQSQRLVLHALPTREQAEALRSAGK